MNKTGVICPKCGEKTDANPCQNCGYEFPECGGCGELMEKGEHCYQVRSGYIGEDGKFVRKDRGGQLFHPGRCMNSEK